MNEARCKRLARQAIADLSLDLEGLCVLTEAATGYYALTPLLAALAGAEHVLAVTRDSAFGGVEEVQSGVAAMAKRWGLLDRITFLQDRNDPRIGRADVVTNSGHLRPLDAALVGMLKATAAVPLMYETWEFRPADLDLEACRRRGLPVLGTDESHPALRTIEYVGLLAQKLLFELDVEVLDAKILVAGAGRFGGAVEVGLRAAGARVRREAPALLETQMLTNVDALVVAEHEARDPIIGPGGRITLEDLRAAGRGLVVAHIAGAVDEATLRAAGTHFRPVRLAPAGYMSVATDYLGPRPLVYLHAAGLKVGSALARARRDGRSRAESEAFALRTCTCSQAFSSELQWA